jgi:hypothetical protein
MSTRSSKRSATKLEDRARKEPRSRDLEGGKGAHRDYIAEAERDGAKILVDGRNAVVEGKEERNVRWPDRYRLCHAGDVGREGRDLRPGNLHNRTETLDDAIKIENANPYGNAASGVHHKAAGSRAT